MKVSALTALVKPNNRIRGIAAGDSFRRLVTKAVARQYQEELRSAVFPHNVGLSDRSGTDAAIHLLRYLSDMHPDKVIVSIDGVGAFDHVCRARMFEQLMSSPTLQGLVLFVRQWYGSASKFVWVDDNGEAHIITQGDGGEQGDALMPALFCLALHPALEHLREVLPENATVVAYLDDLYVFCEKSEVCNVLEAAQADLQRICHIDTNLGKLAVWGKNYSDPPEGSIAKFGHAAWKCDKPAEQRGIKVLGAPFGTLGICKVSTQICVKRRRSY